MCVFYPTKHTPLQECDSVPPHPRKTDDAWWMEQQRVSGIILCTGLFQGVMLETIRITSRLGYSQIDLYKWPRNMMRLGEFTLDITHQGTVALVRGSHPKLDWMFSNLEVDKSPKSFYAKGRASATACGWLKDASKRRETRGRVRVRKFIRSAIYKPLYFMILIPISVPCEIWHIFPFTSSYQCH